MDTVSYQVWSLFLNEGNSIVIDVAQLCAVLQVWQDLFLGVQEKLVNRLDLFRRVNLSKPFPGKLKKINSPFANQCDQIGRFLQVRGNKLSHKSSPKLLWTFGAISNNITIM